MNKNHIPELADQTSVACLVPTMRAMASAVSASALRPMMVVAATTMLLVSAVHAADQPASTADADAAAKAVEQSTAAVKNAYMELTTTYDTTNKAVDVANKSDGVTSEQHKADVEQAEKACGQAAEICEKFAKAIGDDINARRHELAKRPRRNAGHTTTGLPEDELTADEQKHLTNLAKQKLEDPAADVERREQIEDLVSVGMGRLDAPRQFGAGATGNSGSSNEDDYAKARKALHTLFYYKALYEASAVEWNKQKQKFASERLAPPPMASVIPPAITAAVRKADIPGKASADETAKKIEAAADRVEHTYGNR